VTIHSWRAALTRWGDTLFRLALLLSDDQATAERAATQAFTRAFATPPEDAESALYAALVKTGTGRRFPFRRRVLPRSLAQIAAFDRVLLGLWLLRDLDGPRLLAITGQSADTLVPRLAAAVMRFLDADDPAHSDHATRSAFDLWLRRRLGLSVPSIDLTVYGSSVAEDWQAAIDQLRQILREAVGRRQLTTPVIETIEAAMLEPEDDSPSWWRQRAAWIGALVIILSLLWMIKPWQQGAGPETAAALTTRELVQETLDAWTTAPVSGTLHRKVVASDPRVPLTSLTTDVWLAADGVQHRIEVRNKSTLVEWQIADGKEQLTYAVEPSYSPCDWATESAVLDRLARTFHVPVEQQVAVRDERLKRGAYGQGYLALQAALSASDLRSFGTRVENKTPLLVLGYTDQRTIPERKLLLWLDPEAKELHAVREVAAAGGQANARDIWRLQAREETITAVSKVPPSWPRQPTPHDELLDPACPSLDPEHVISLRAVTGTHWGWQQWYLPMTLPEDIERAAMLTPSTVLSTALNTDQTSAVFVGPNRWLSMRASAGNHRQENSIDHGGWRVNLDERAGLFYGSACRHFTDARSGFCVPLIEITARGWTRDELLGLIESLQPLNAQTWLHFNDLFLDPRPLSSSAYSTLAQSIPAIQRLKQQSFRSRTEREARINPDRTTWQDPYHVPVDHVSPQRSVQEQWLIYSDAHAVRFQDLTSHPDGTLLTAQIYDGRQYISYNATSGASWYSQEDGLQQLPPVDQWTGEEILVSLLRNTTPITVTEQRDNWVLEQAYDRANIESWYNGRFLNLFGTAAWLADPTRQNFLQRVTIARDTALPTRAEVVDFDAQGRETALITITLTILPQSDTPSFTLPSLPADTLVYEVTPYTSSSLKDDLLNIALPGRTLVWPKSSSVTIDQDKPLKPSIFTAPNRANTIYQLLDESLGPLDESGLLRATQYRLAVDDRQVTVRQGPRNFLRHMLRYRSALMPGRGESWTLSKSFSVPIAGEQRTVWLLATPISDALVFEIDDLLVHVSGPDAATLERVTLPELSKLEWSSN
jgi:hypothetical protein